MSDNSILVESRKIYELEFVDDRKLDFPAIFGNSNPIHLEIGSGRGEFLIKIAKQNPQINFIGIDLKEKRFKTLLRKLFKEHLLNVRVAKIFLDENIIKFIDENSIETIYLQYPDPWPKKRHNRRRIIQDNFVSAMKNLLVPGGLVDIVTDHREYALWIVDHFRNREDFFALYEIGFKRVPDKNHIETYFEKLKREEGFEPYFMKFRSRL
ncbi:MAG: tRNA (guanosine(46)-N7)-methyltransferase TrmB [Candidatus Cloacimonetes bacterium]|nr:tRNA (guanosine(46)-N7)-methyltransferase TrmB [Candidatus Cloacimonadota bacterium]